jgi:hypothetical protein
VRSLPKLEIIFVSIGTDPYVTRYAGSYKCENLAEPVYVQRSVRFQYSQTFLDPFVAPNKIITHFLLIAVVQILADIVRAGRR